MNKNNVSKFIGKDEGVTWGSWVFRYFSPALIVGVAFAVGGFLTSFQYRIFDSPEQKIEVVSVATNDEVHMEYKDKVIEFVPREEVGYKLDNINDKIDGNSRQLDAINKKLDWIIGYKPVASTKQ